MGVGPASRYVPMGSMRSWMRNRRLPISCFAKNVVNASENAQTSVFLFGTKSEFKQNLFI